MPKQKAKQKRQRRGLAQRLMDLEEQVLELHDAATDPAERRELLKSADELSRQASRLIEAKLGAATRKYSKAAAGLDAAGEAARAAIADVNRVRAAIDKVAAALDLVCRIAV